MNVVDSSGWLEYFADGPNADFFAPPIEDREKLIVPSIAVLEVFKRVLQQRDESIALHVVAAMHQGRIVDLDSTIALSAGKLGVESGLPLADSVIHATARQHDAIVWTQDSDFRSLDDARLPPGTSD